MVLVLFFLAHFFFEGRAIGFRPVVVAPSERAVLPLARILHISHAPHPNIQDTRGDDSENRNGTYS